MLLLTEQFWILTSVESTSDKCYFCFLSLLGLPRRLTPNWCQFLQYRCVIFFCYMQIYYLPKFYLLSLYCNFLCLMLFIHFCDFYPSRNLFKSFLFFLSLTVCCHAIFDCIISITRFYDN